MRKKNEKGITLIALIITIIILLILAGISIATLTGENGILRKASTAKEESLIKQYEEEINLIIIDEIAERKIQAKEEAFIQSLEDKIQEKEWVEETKKCNESGVEETEVEKNNRLIVTTKEGYEIIIEVDNEKLTAQIIDITKNGEIKEEKTALNFSITNNKLTEGTNININITSTKKLQKLELKVQDIVIFSENNIRSTTYNKSSIGIEQLKNLAQLPFYDDIIVTLEVTTTTGSKETKTIENVKNYTVSTATQLNQLADVVNGGNNLQNETIIQLADIDVNLGKWTENADGTTTFQSSAVEWQGIGSATHDYDANIDSNVKAFAGIFNGKEHKIEGVYINNIAKDVVGLFSRNQGTIKNVVLKNSIIKGRYNIGGIAGANQGTMQNCKNYASVSGTRCVGGICGWSTGTLDSNVNYGQVSNAVETGWKLTYEYIGGIVGWGENTITTCGNYGNITSTTAESKFGANGIGGIIGSGKYGSIMNCYNLGSIVSKGIDGGGIIGVVLNEKGQKVTISKCYNGGEINVERFAGGINGYGHYMQIQDCYNKGNIKGNNNGTGGITGWTGENGSIINCYNIGNITGIAEKYTGGILGNYGTPTLTNCYHLNTASTYAVGDNNGAWGTLRK